MKDTLEGKRCIVTGGGSGIGRGIALSLAAAGARLAVTGRREEMLRETADQIRETGGHASIQVMDVTDPDAVAHGFERILGTLEGLDVLVNNAGTGGPNACAAGGPERWDEIIRTNLDGVYHCTRAAAPA